MNDSDYQDWPPLERKPKPDQEYLNKINKEMIELAPRIAQVAAQPCDAEIWATIGDLRYGHPVTPLLLRYRALMWMALHPPDPRGEKMCSRPGPYTVYVRRADLIEVLVMGERTVDRMLAEVREAFHKKPYDRITVEQFCFEHNLPEEKIQQQLHELFLKRWNKHKPRNE